MTTSTAFREQPREYRRPTRGEVVAARIILRRNREGRGNVRITPRMRAYAAYTGYDD